MELSSMNSKFIIFAGGAEGIVIGDGVSVTRNFNSAPAAASESLPTPEVSECEKAGKFLLALIESGEEQMAIKKINEGAALGVKNRDGDTPLILATRAGLPNVVSLLIEKGVPVDELNRHGMTALHAAAINGATASAKMLLAANANPNIRDEDNNLASDYARMMKRADISAMISSQPARVAEVDNAGVQAPSSKPPHP